ncbi:SRR1-like protein [Kryptolebias marmoratus]|uniref:SRR1 domain containing n=1 Tax=Kryptolebias marmoratus TaxID=37003 RepID=A0A3Q3AR29_KRYMA|nr:SRR1-like protein [Kryptolebias marmoratus]
MSDTSEEWKVARRRKGAPKKFKSHQVSSASSFHQEEHLDVGKLIKIIRDTESELRCEDFWSQWKKQLLLAASGLPESNDTKDHLERNPEDTQCQQLECVCYGLGSFSSCVSARYQLAMLLLLLDAGQIPLQDCSVYDPAFSSAERDVLKELGLTVLAENEEGKRQATKPTLFYLMHCGKALYNNLLWKNWSAQCLTLVVIIGNSFNGITERTIERELKRDYSYISKAVGLCEDRPLPCPSHLIDVFSDTALITFPSDSLNRLPQSFWAEPPEPQYLHCSDLEIILKQSSLSETPETDDR